MQGTPKAGYSGSLEMAEARHYARWLGSRATGVLSKKDGQVIQ